MKDFSTNYQLCKILQNSQQAEQPKPFLSRNKAVDAAIDAVGSILALASVFGVAIGCFYL